MKIKDWSNDERPRERVMALGPEAVSNAELLAILIGSGTPEVTSVDLMRIVLSEHGDSLRALGTLSRQELEKYNGIGPAKAVTIQAAMELGKRLLLETKGPKAKFCSSSDAHDYFRVKMSDMPHEECHLLLLNVKNQFMGHHVVSRGGISESSVDVRLVLRHALIAGAPNLILAHNHPSGNLHPSAPDKVMTEKIGKALDTMDIKLLNHLIVTRDGYFSFADDDLI